MKCLLIDIGSTFIKYGVYDECAGTLLMQDSILFPQPCISCGEIFVVSAEEIKDNILKIFSLTEAYPCGKIFFSVQMHGYLLKDGENGFSDYVSWRDTSGDTSNPKFQGIDFNQMGTSLKKNLPLVKLLLTEWEGEFFTLGSYVAWILTGRNATHITDACASGFFCADTGLPNPYAAKRKMPEVYKSVTPVGIYKDMAVYTPVGDHQASFFGSGAGEEKYLVNIGTATQISCVHDVEYPDGEYEKRPYFDDNRLYTVSGLVGGNRIYSGDGEEELYGQIVNAIGKLPPKKEILLGGGGAKQIFDYLSTKLGDHGLGCSLIDYNIGMEGLKMIAENAKVKAGTMLSELCFPNFPIIAKNSGLDFFILDNEHGYFDFSDISKLIVNANLIGMNAIVRIGEKSRGHITKLADMGVRGFLLPMTNCREDIEEVVRYAKYTPIGKRGISTTRAHTLYNPPPLAEYMKSANEQMKIYAQIETVSGVRNIEQILAVTGVDGILIGPNDLSADLGCVSDKNAVMDAVQQIAAAANRAGKPWGIITGDKELIAFSLANNASMISMGSELNMLINGCKKIRETLA